MMKPNYFALSFVGRRSSNQDAFITLELNDTSYFIAVADGMGGATSGHVASQTVLKEAERFLKWTFAKDPNPKNLKNILKQTFTICQKAIADAIQNNPELSGMGTTLACVLICGNRFVVGNIGDSRVYKHYRNEFIQITEDHTYIQDFLKKEGGVISPEIQAQYSSFLTRSIDGGEDTPDIYPAENDFDTLLPGTAFMICSDGLILDKSATDTSLLKELYLGTKSLKKAAENMISSAFQSGSSDNITVALFEYGAIPDKKDKRMKYKYPPEEKSPTRKAPPSKRSPVRMLIAATMLLFLVIVTAIVVNRSGLNIFKKKSQPATTQKSEKEPKLEAEVDRVQKQAIPAPFFQFGDDVIPVQRNAPLTWSWDGVLNDSIKFRIFFYNEKVQSLVAQIEAKTKDIKLDTVQTLIEGQIYSVKVKVVTNIDSAESDFRKIAIVPERREK